MHHLVRVRNIHFVLLKCRDGIFHFLVTEGSAVMLTISALLIFIILCMRRSSISKLRVVYNCTWNEAGP